MDWTIDWTEIVEKLKTENIISYVSSFDVVDLAGDPYVIVTVILVLFFLIFFKFVRTLALLIGSVAIFFALSYSLPGDNQVLNLVDIAILGGTCFVVAGCWVYIFLIRND